MRNLSTTSVQSYWQELEKIAATRQVKMLRQLFASGQTGAAEDLAKNLHSAGVLKVTGPGTQLKHLGSGAEGVATTVIGSSVAPTRRVVRKTFDTQGPLYSRQLLAEKMHAGRALRDNPDVATLLSKRLGKGGKGGRYLMYEMAEGSRPRDIPENLKGIVSKGVSKRTLMDVIGNEGNYVTSGGRGKILDYLPARTSTVRDLLTGQLPFQKEWQNKVGIRVRDPSTAEMPVVRDVIERQRQMGLPTVAASKVKFPEAPVPEVASHPALAKIVQAKTFRELYGTGTTASDFNFGGLRRADPARALRGLGGGSR